MSSTIDIGTRIDIDDLIESRMLIQANSGGGKSGIARVIMEESVGKIPFIVLERKGEYYTLKEKYPDVLVIGGRNGDIPISMQAAPRLARFIISHQLTVVIDMSGLEGDDQRAVFLRDFLKGLMNLTDDLWCRYLVFLEEAHIFCGQQEMTPSAKYVKLLMSEGRKMGFAGILITQRISKLHKDAAAECNNKFIGRTFLDLDMNRSASEMGLVGQEKFKLRDLKPQRFWAFGTSIIPHHVHEVVIKNAKTKFPKAGVAINIANVKPTEKVKKALAKLNELPAEAAKELKDIKELQAEVVRLNKLLKSPTAKVAPSISSDSSLAQSLRGEIALLKEQAKQKDRDLLEHRKVIAQFTSKMEGMQKILSKPITLEGMSSSNANTVMASVGLKMPGAGGLLKEVHTVPSENISTHEIHKNKSPNHKAPSRGSSGDESTLKVGGAEKAIITLLGSFPDRAFSKVQIAVATEYAVNGGGFNNALGRLNTLGWINRGQRISINMDAMPAIIQAIGEIEPKEYGYEQFKNKLGRAEREIYQVLLDNVGFTLTKKEVAERTESKYEPTGGGFNNALGRLNTLELLKRDNGTYQINPELLELAN